MPDQTDEHFMKLAMAVCQRGIDAGQAPFGACIVRDGDVAIAPDGDINGDGAVNSADILGGLRIAPGIQSPTAGQLLHGDVAPLVNGIPQPDGVINAADLLMIQRKLFGLVNFP